MSPRAMNAQAADALLTALTDAQLTPQPDKDRAYTWRATSAGGAHWRVKATYNPAARRWQAELTPVRCVGHPVTGGTWRATGRGYERLLGSSAQEVAAAAVKRITDPPRPLPAERGR